MNDTPETDGITFFATKDMMPPYNTVPAEFARKLERERDIAQIWSRKWKELARALRTDRDITKWERDELIVAAFEGAME